MAENNQAQSMDSGDYLRHRADTCVCKFCGGKLVVSMIVYNKYGGQGMELYCPACQKIEYGTKPEIYQLAKDFVDTFEFNYYTEMEEDKRNYQLNIAKIGEIMAWTLENAPDKER